MLSTIVVAFLAFAPEVAAEDADADADEEAAAEAPAPQRVEQKHTANQNTAHGKITIIHQ